MKINVSDKKWIYSKINNYFKQFLYTFNIISPQIITSKLRYSILKFSILRKYNELKVCSCIISPSLFISSNYIFHFTKNVPHIFIARSVVVCFEFSTWIAFFFVLFCKRVTLPLCVVKSPRVFLLVRSKGRYIQQNQLS